MINKSILILIFWGYAITFAIYGVSGWGYQPGGDINCILTFCFIAMSLVSITTACIRLFRFNQWYRAHLLILAIFFFSIVFISWWSEEGYAMLTSRHNQGAEKYFGVLILFIINFLCIRHKKLCSNQSFELAKFRQNSHLPDLTKMNKTATIYKRNNSLIIGSINYTRQGVGLDSGSYTVLKELVNNEELGNKIIETLNQSRVNVVSPDNSKYLTKPLEKAAGVKSYKAFIEGTKLCSVIKSDNYRVIPCHNGGSTGINRGFHELPEKQVFTEVKASSEKLGEAVKNILEQCE